MSKVTDSFDYSGDSLRRSRLIYRHLVNEVGTEGDTTITYGELAKLLDVHHRALRMPLAKIQDECRLKRWPTITTLVVDQGSGKPNEGCDATDDFEDYRKRVSEIEWPKSPWW